MSIRSLAITAWVLMTLLAARARAGVVFEHHVSHRPVEFEPAINQLLDELEKDGQWIAKARSVRAALGALASAPSLADGNLKAADLLAHLNNGFQAYLEGRYEQAISQLGSAITEGHANPALVLSASKYRLALLDALVGLAASHHRRNQGSDRKRSIELMQELIRSFPDRVTSLRDAYGPEPDKIYRDALQQLQARGTGNLAVEVDHPDALIYINETEPPQNATFKANLSPGRYRVLVKMPKSNGRTFVAEVKPNATTKLTVIWDLTTALTVSDRWVGFANVPEQTAVRYARQLAAQLGHATYVLVAPSSTKRGASLTATVYRTQDGTVLRVHAARLDGDPSARIGALARVLRADIKSDVQSRVESTPSRNEAPALRERRGSGRTPWLIGAGALGIAGIVGGALTLKFGFDANAADAEFRTACAVSCPSEVALTLEAKRDAARRNAIVSGVAGGIALAGGVVLALIGRSRRVSNVAIAPRRDGLMVSYAMRF